MSLPTSFWNKTASSTGCVVWQGAQNSKGYGCFMVAGASQLAHRVVWEDVNGPIPEGLTIDHLCRVRSCVNVEHMELVSIAENTARRPRRLQIGGLCRSGHFIDSDDDLYKRTGRDSLECKACKREQRREQRNAA